MQVCQECAGREAEEGAAAARASLCSSLRLLRVTPHNVRRVESVDTVGQSPTQTAPPPPKVTLNYPRSSVPKIPRTKCCFAYTYINIYR